VGSGLAIAAIEGASFLPIAAVATAQAMAYAGGTLLYMRGRNRKALRAMEQRGEILPPAPGA
jgi:hypothetical protein